MNGKVLVGILVFLILLLSGSCDFRSEEEKAMDEATEIYDDLLSDMNTRLAESTNNNERSFYEVTQELITEPTPEPTPKPVDLNLPLQVGETTYVYDNEESSLRITSDGKLQKASALIGRESKDGYFRLIKDEFSNVDYTLYKKVISSGVTTWERVSESNPMTDEDISLLNAFHAVYDWYNVYDWQDIDTDVRSLSAGFGLKNETVFFIKNDNSLWGYGSNTDGLLGDGTGMDKDVPVHILDDVAWISQFFGTSGPVFAIKTDKTLWRWGDGVNYSPIMVTNDVVAFYSHNNMRIIQKSDGSLYSYYTTTYDGEIEESFSLLLQEAAYAEFDNVNYFINSKHELIYLTDYYETTSEFQEIVDSNVTKLFNADPDYYGENLFYLKSDNTLWGIGENENGELGDTTKAPRKEPVKIADNIKEAFVYSFLKTDGTFWIWDEENPTPRKIFDDVAYVADDCVFFNDSTVTKVVTWEQSPWAYFVENVEDYLDPNQQYAKFSGVILNDVKIPSSITFD